MSNAPSTHLVDGDASAARWHHFDLHVAGHGEHATEGLQSVAAQGASAGLDSRADGNKVARLASCHDVELTPGVAILGER